MDHWQRLHTAFMALMAEEDEIVPRQQPRHFLCAYGVYEGADQFGNWTLSNVTAENLQVRFELLASQAGLTLGVPPGVTPLRIWLHRLFLYLCQKNSSHTSIGSDQGGIIERVCEASATFCGRLHIDCLNDLAGAPPSQDKPVIPGPAIPQSAPRATCTQLRQLREESHIEFEQLAEALGVSPRSIYRHFSGESLPHEKHIAKYQEIFAKILERKVVISKTSGKCQ